MTLGVAHSVLALSVVLIARLGQDLSAAVSGALVVRVNVRNVDHDAASRRFARSRWDKPGGCVGAVQPHPSRAVTYLGMDDRSIGRSVDPGRREAKDMNEEIVLRGNVRAGEERD